MNEETKNEEDGALGFGGAIFLFAIFAGIIFLVISLMFPYYITSLEDSLELNTEARRIESEVVRKTIQDMAQNRGRYKIDRSGRIGYYVYGTIGESMVYFWPDNLEVGDVKYNYTVRQKEMRDSLVDSYKDQSTQYTLDVLKKALKP